MKIDQNITDNYNCIYIYIYIYTYIYIYIYIYIQSLNQGEYQSFICAH